MAALLGASATTAATALVVALHGDPAPVAASPMPAATAPPARPTPAVEVNGAPLPHVTPRTVGAALAAAHVPARSGHYFSVVHQRVLGPDDSPARITVNGRPSSLAAEVLPGDRILVHSGADRVEPTETVLVRTHAVAASPLYVGGRAGLVRVVRGAMSREVVSRRVLRRPAAGHLVKPGAVALTFDDGPTRGWTRRVLELLEHHRVHATFCVIGRQVPDHRGLVRDIAAAGNALCDHTWDHDERLAHRSHKRIVSDLMRGRRAIIQATGVPPAFFRAPGGNWSPRLTTVARHAGLAPLHWTVDPRDWSRPGVDTIIRTVLREVRPGGVILMHDGGGNRVQTLRALRVLIPKLRKLGYHFVVPPVR